MYDLLNHAPKCTRRVLAATRNRVEIHKCCTRSLNDSSTTRKISVFEQQTTEVRISLIRAYKSPITLGSLSLVLVVKSKITSVSIKE